MRNALLLEFPLEEFERRIDLLVEGMKKRNLDAVIMTNDENTYYFTGYRSISWHSKVSTPGVLVVTKDKDLCINTSKGAIETARVTSCVDDFRYFSNASYNRKSADAKVFDTYSKTIASMLVEKGIEKGRIGFELRNGQKMHLNYLNEKDLFNELSGAEIVDASELLWDIRKIKSPYEVEVIKKCCDINCKSFDKGIDAIYDGITETLINQTILQEYFTLGAEHTLELSVRSGKSRSVQKYCMSTDNVVNPGEIITIEGGPEYKRYFSDIIRHAIIGEPSKAQRELFDSVREALELGIKSIKPGIKFSELNRIINENLDSKKAVQKNINRQCAGYSIGVGSYEMPIISDTNEDIIEEGMVLVINPAAYNDEVGMIEMKENILVTESGCERLSTSNNDLRIL